MNIVLQLRCSERVKELGESDAARGAIDDISNGINEQHLGDQIEVTSRKMWVCSVFNI